MDFGNSSENQADSTAGWALARACTVTPAPGCSSSLIVGASFKTHKLHLGITETMWTIVCLKACHLVTLVIPSVS